MLRSFLGSVLRTAAASTSSQHVCSSFVRGRYFASLTSLKPIQSLTNPYKPRLISTIAVGEPKSLLLSPVLKSTISITLSRNVTKFSLVKGKRKTVKAVLKRFKRLHWGIWIRTHSGRHKKMFKKSPALKRRLRQHVFTNATQSWMLDKMVTNYWRRPKHYIDDPYSPYHNRDEYFATKGNTFKV